MGWFQHTDAVEPAKPQERGSPGQAADLGRSWGLQSLTQHNPGSCTVGAHIPAALVISTHAGGFSLWAVSLLPESFLWPRIRETLGTGQKCGDLTPSEAALTTMIGSWCIYPPYLLPSWMGQF